MTRVIGKMGLTAEQKAIRKNFLTCSFLPALAAGDENRIMDEYLIKIDEREDSDLSNVVPVQIGVCTEPLNADFYEMTTGHEITREGEGVVSEEYSFLRATLDGYVSYLPAVWQAKHVNQFAKPEEVIAKYTPQVTGEMLCAGVDKAILSVFYGTLKYDYHEIELDPFYAEALMEKAAAFWQAVQTRTPPSASESVSPPAPPSEWREVDMAGNNEWASLAGDWLNTKVAAGKHKKADKGLRELVEADVGLACGYGLQAKRTKAGAIRLSEVKDAK